MPISYKHKIYTTLGTPTALSGNVVSATDSAGVPVKDYTIKGRSIVWNQLIQNGNFVDETGWDTYNGTGSVSNNKYTLTAAGINTYSHIVQYMDKSLFIVGHKYYITATITPQYSAGRLTVALHNSYNQQLEVWKAPASSGITNFVSTIFTPSSKFISDAKNLVRFVLYCPQTESAQGNVTTISNVWMTDLTKMFGSGNEPATPAEFRAMFPDDYYPYNAGELKSIMPTSVEASGVNLLDLVGRKEISGNRVPTDAYPEIDTHVYYRGIAPNGYLHPGTVVEATISSSSMVVKTGTLAGSDGYGVGIPLTVIPSTTYYIKCTTPGVVSIGFVNSNKIITTSIWTLSNNQFTTPSDCRYVLIIFRPNALDTLATFENICVSTVQTNEYQPYNKYRANIPSSKYFPDGMRSAGSAYDEINFLSQKAIKRIGVVDLGTLNWDSNSGSYPANSFYSDILTNAKRDTHNVVSAGKFYNLYINENGRVIAVTASAEAYNSSEAFKAAMSGVMLYYELATPVETTITPPLQALSTFKGFNSFSAPNSLTQNGPLSVTYYAEGGTNPEKGWLTSYKRKLYMGRNIEWNQLVNYNNFQNQVITNGITFVSNGDGLIVANGTCTGDGASYNIIPWTAVNPAAKFLICGCPQGGSEFTYKIWDTNYQSYKDFGEGCVTGDMEAYSIWINIKSGTTVRDLVFKPQFFNLTKMFGAGNEPSTPEEFWSYFDHKLYPYNAGETQPLFKISRKSYIYKEPAGYTVYFADWVWIADTVTITVEYADGSTATLTSQSDVGGKSYSNIVKMTFTDTDSDRYVRYKMPANGGSEETLNLWPTATLVLTADVDIEGIDK